MTFSFLCRGGAIVGSIPWAWRGLGWIKGALITAWRRGLAWELASGCSSWFVVW
jgi:hypothetical protein